MESSRGGEEVVHVALVVFEQQRSVLHEEAEHNKTQPYGTFRRACRLEYRCVGTREFQTESLLFRSGESDHFRGIEKLGEYGAVERYDCCLGCSAVGCLVRYVEDRGFQRFECYSRSGLQTKRTAINALNIYGDRVEPITFALATRSDNEVASTEAPGLAVSW